MTIYRCEICNYEFDESKQKKKFSELKKCPACGAKKEKMKRAKDFFENIIEQLGKYRAGTPKGGPEIED